MRWEIIVVFILKLNMSGYVCACMCVCGGFIVSSYAILITILEKKFFLNGNFVWEVGNGKQNEDNGEVARKIKQKLQNRIIKIGLEFHAR